MNVIRLTPLFTTVSVALLFIALLGAASLAHAQQDSRAPDITVREEEDRTIREYRVNGQLYAIEVQPTAGPSYYLVDENGDGDFRRSDTRDIAIPSWVLISW